MRYFQRKGSTKVEVISESRTAAPNIWWPAEQMQLHGFTECPPDAEALKVEDEKEVEVLIAAKQRELAIAALRAEGKIDTSGKLKKEKKP